MNKNWHYSSFELAWLECKINVFFIRNFDPKCTLCAIECQSFGKHFVPLDCFLKYLTDKYVYLLSLQFSNCLHSAYQSSIANNWIMNLKGYKILHRRMKNSQQLANTFGWDAFGSNQLVQQQLSAACTTTNLKIQYAYTHTRTTNTIRWLQYWKIIFFSLSFHALFLVLCFCSVTAMLYFILWTEADKWLVLF